MFKFYFVYILMDVALLLFCLYLNGCSIIGKVNYILSRNMQH